MKTLILSLVIASLTFQVGLVKGQDTVTDYDGNIYHTVTIGNQVWLKENITSLHYSDGTEIPEVVAYNNSDSLAGIFGRLYTWDAAMKNETTPGVQGVCPTGWHVPTSTEFTQLENFLGGAAVAGGKMKDTTSGMWNYSATGGATNSSGFTALPAGEYDAHQFMQFQLLHEYAVFWTSTQTSTLLATERYLEYNSPKSLPYNWYKPMKYSIRCLRDAVTGLLNKPKDIVYDLVRKCCYISNYQGDAIVRQDSLGNQEYLLQGINSPMGLHLLGDTLIISSNSPSKITLLNIVSGTVISELPVAGAQYLSMMDRDPRSGLIYVIDQIGAIYKLNIQQPACALFVSTNAGIAYGSQTLEVDTANNRLLVFKWDPGFIKGVNLSDSTDIFNASSQYISQIQSSQKGPEGEIYVSSYNNNSVYVYDKFLSVAPSIIASGLIQPSGIAYNPNHHSLMVCNYGGNIISEIPLIHTGTAKNCINPEAFNVFPCPADQRCYIRFSGINTSNVRINIHDINGKIVRSYQWEFPGNENCFEIPTTDLRAGIYQISCICNDIALPVQSLFVIH